MCICKDSVKLTSFHPYLFSGITIKELIDIASKDKNLVKQAIDNAPTEQIKKDIVEAMEKATKEENVLALLEDMR